MGNYVIAVLLAVCAPWAMAGEQVRELAPFKDISGEGFFKLVVTAGLPQSVKLVAKDDDLANVTSTVVGEELRLSMSKKNKWITDDRVVITITVPQLRQFRMEGVGSVELNQLSGDKFVLNHQGVGSITARGKVKHFVLRAEGVGTLNDKDLDAAQVEAWLQGVGSALVRASESLDAHVEGVGSLTYYGHPAKVTKRADGVGSVRAGD